jgi:hypothetical protein
MNDNLPDPNSFTLPLQDKGINVQRISLKPNLLRKTIFEGKNFIFFCEKTYREYKKMVKKAGRYNTYLINTEICLLIFFFYFVGGRIELYKTNFENISNDIFTDNNIIMQITNDSISNDVAIFNAIICKFLNIKILILKIINNKIFLDKKMQEKKLRMISETEIPLALIYVSIEQFCNPKYHFKELMKRKNLNKDTSKILALDTQDTLLSVSPTINFGPSNSTQVCIPETEDFTQDNVIQSKNYIINTCVVKI